MYHVTMWPASVGGRLRDSLPASPHSSLSSSLKQPEPQCGKKGGRGGDGNSRDCCAATCTRPCLPALLRLQYLLQVKTQNIFKNFLHSYYLNFLNIVF